MESASLEIAAPPLATEPSPPKRPKLDMITVRLPAELHQQIKLAASRRRQTLNAWCVDALKALLDAPDRP